MKNRFISGIDWKSKLLDLLIVILGITIAFKLNNWNENQQNRATLSSYMQSFTEENQENITNLTEARNHTARVSGKLDSLKAALLAKDYENPRLSDWAFSVMSLGSFQPSATTMENIKAAGDFELIDEIALRKQLITTYNSFQRSRQLEGLLFDYVEAYVTPYYYNRVRFTDPSTFNLEVIQDPRFENMIFGYALLLEQQYNGYEDSLEKARQLSGALDRAAQD